MSTEQKSPKKEFPTSSEEKELKISNVKVYFPEVQAQTLNSYMKYSVSFDY